MRVLTLLLLILIATSPNAQVSSAFTYQGELLDGGQPANGDFDFEFFLYFNETGGVPFAGPVVIEDVAVDNGLFTTPVDFGPGVYGAADQWIQISVRDGASTGSFTTLAPRQPLTPTPLASHAEMAETADTALSVEPNSIDSQSIENGSINLVDVDSTIQARVGNSCPAGTAIRVIAVDGGIVCVPIPTTDADITGVAAGPGLEGGGAVGEVTLSLDEDAVWAMNGNAGLANSAFIGTTDDAPVNIHVDGKRAMRYEWGFSGSGAPNIIGGVANNSLPDNYEASVIAGGGLAGAPNAILGNASVVGGGIGNEINGSWSTIPGGRANTVNANDSVAMGQGATANHDNVFIWNDGGSFSSTGRDQFLIDASGGVGIGTNNPSDQLHISIPSGDAMRVQIGGQTRFRIHDNGGISVGVNSGPPSNGLLVNGDIRYSQPRTRWLMLNSPSFVQGESSNAPFDYDHISAGLELNEPTFCSFGGNSFNASVKLPHGAVIREFRAHVTENDGDASLRINLRRMSETGVAENPMAQVVTNGANSSPRVFTDTTINTPQIDNENFAYSIDFFGGCNLGNTVLHSVRIKYEIRDVL